MLEVGSYQPFLEALPELKLELTPFVERAEGAVKGVDGGAPLEVADVEDPRIERVGSI